MKYKFPQPLIEGLIKSRPNRFIMFVEVGGKEQKCHCPSTGRIGDIEFEDIACLVSEAENPDRKTKYTVEAISFDPPSKKSKKWIGINQVKMNRYVEAFFKEKGFEKMIKGGETIRREKMLGKSRIDFKTDKDYIEVKMPLISLPTPEKFATTRPPSKFDSFDRLIKHFNDLGGSLKGNSRAIILLCFQYDAQKFTPPKANKDNSVIMKAVRKANKKGVENWQANFKIDKKGIELTKYFSLDLF